MPYLLDIAMVLLAILFVVFGFKRGVVKSLVSFVGIIVAAVAAILLASTVARWVFDAFIRDSFQADIAASLQGSAGESAAVRVQQVLAALPKFVRNAFAAEGSPDAALQQAVESPVDQAANAVVALASPIIINLIRVVAVVVLMFLFVILVRLLAKGADTVFRLPVLRQLNCVAGGVFGLLKFVVFVWLFMAILKLVLPMFTKVPAIFSSESIESTVLFRFAYEHNLLVELTRFIS